MRQESSQPLDQDVMRHPTSSGAFEIPCSRSPSGAQSSEPSRAEVTEALESILQSDSFRSSDRGKQFLNFVVYHRLDNPTEPIKERTIGVALFNRSADYATGEDSVVRAQAREVRRRLEKYYAESSNPLRINLPVGSYWPEFKWVVPQQANQLTISNEVLNAARGRIEAPVKTRTRVGYSIPWKLLFGAFATTAFVVALALFARTSRTKTTKSTVLQFWSPAFASSKPFLICLPRPIMYRPSAELYERSAQSSGEFDREVDRMTHPPHLRPNDTLHWAEMHEFFDYGVSEGDVQAAFRISSYLGRQGKDSEVRIGEGFSTADLRNSPAVVIGAFSNPLAIEMTSHLHFAFADDAKGLHIQEQGPSGRSWYPKHGDVGEDYGLVTRLMDSNTGQFVVLAAGVEASGSDAAADLIVDSDELEKVLRNAPKYWPQRNVQILVSTTVKDHVAGPPKVLAVNVW